MFKSLDSIASVVGIFMYLTISKFKQVLRSRKGHVKVSTTTLVHDTFLSIQFIFDVKVNIVFHIGVDTKDLHFCHKQ